jgi:hypothetical protein
VESQREVAEEWDDQIAITQHEHYLAALRFARLHYWIGIPLVLLTAIVGRSVFATPQQQRHASGRIGVRILSVSATVLAVLQTFLSYNERAEKHRMAGARYGALGWQLALMLAQDSDCSGLDDIGKQLDALAQESPNIPKVVHKAMAGLRPRWQRASNQWGIT